ncbi:MAG: AAA family ATPase [Planctomycetes bacterium]|nr:AAA family ATPase [Planctomycetota bacterium]
MIDKVVFQNFKALRDVSLDLERFTVLVGPNASGKTSILQGLDHLVLASSEQRRTKLIDAMGNPGRIATSGTYGRMLLQCSSHLGELGVAINAPRSESDGNDQSWLSEMIDLPDGGGSCRVQMVYPGGHFRDNQTLGPAVLLRLDVKRLVAPSYSEEPVPHMEPDGEGLASVLAYMASNEPDDYQAILEALRGVIPSVEAMRFPRAAVTRTVSEIIEVEEKTFTHRVDREYWGNSIEFDMQGAPRIPVHLVSEGTLFVLGVLTVLMGPGRPQVVLLDDIDRALHPKAQGDLVALLRKLLDQNPEMQIVATSHSPYLLDHLQPEEVRLTTLRDDGSVACGRLDEHPEFDKWKESMRPGEFWSLVGEDWLVEANAGEAGS